jgi:hypothetical protein
MCNGFTSGVRIARQRIAFILGLIVVCVGISRGFQTDTAGNTPSSASRHALLVGVTQYPLLDKRFTLYGGVNDVALMRTVLEGEPYRFPSTNIVTLAGWPADPARRPTRANIEREFDRLARQVRNGDQIVVMMSGHGSQQPADDEPGDVEPDGLDEIFLPADAVGWNGQTGRVENAIVDDDVRRWVTALQKAGAFVWLIFDSCHSGTMARGAPQSVERERQIPAESLIPSDLIQRIRRRSLRAADPDGLLGVADTAGNFVGLYAAQMNETTPEKKLPDRNGRVHGLFTYTLAKLLAGSSMPMTYRELAQRVLEDYRSEGRLGPTPTFEGAGLDREVLGQRTFPARPTLLLGERATGGWELMAGSIHGLAPGAILELFPPAGSRSADRTLGHVKVLSAAADSAIVVPTAHGGMPPPAAPDLVSGLRARVVQYEYGDRALRVGLQWTDADANPPGNMDVVPSSRGPAAIEEPLSRLPQLTSGLVRRTDTAMDADWFVRVVGQVVHVRGT